MFSGVCVFSNTGSSASQFLRNVTSGSFLEADQRREINVPSAAACMYRRCYGELSMRSVTSRKNTSAYIAQIAHSSKGWQGLSGESEHIGGNAESKAASPDSPASRADYRSSRLQGESTNWVYFWMIFDLHFLYTLTSKPNYTGE